MRVGRLRPDPLAVTECTDADPGGKTMFAYFYKLTPFFIVEAICILSMPWLGLIALFVVIVVVLLPVAYLFVYLPYKLVQAVGRAQSHSRVEPRQLGPLGG
jgi:hypothetical protein